MNRTYAMPSNLLANYLTLSREVTAAARTMKAEDMREAVAQIYASARLHKTADDQTYRVEDGVAYIPIEGMLTPQASPCAALFGEAVTEYGFISRAVSIANDDPAVTSIVFDVDSGGGNVDGLDLAAQSIAASEKPTEARVYNFCASAAYWLASQCDRIVALSPAAQIGSIGVAMEEFDDDDSKARTGTVHRVYTSTDAPDKRPDTKTPEGRAKIVAQLDALHSVFVTRVAEGRHVTPEKVSKDFGHGGILIASAALKAGMIDEVKALSISRDIPGVAGSTAVRADSSQKEVRMDLKELEKEHPETYAQALALGKTSGISEERERTAALDQYAAADSGNAAVAKIVAEAKASGKTASDVQPQLLVAIRDGGQTKPDGENPPPVGTFHSETVSGATPTGKLTAEDRRWYKDHGMSDTEIDALAADKEEK